MNGILDLPYFSTRLSVEVAIAFSGALRYIGEMGPHLLSLFHRLLEESSFHAKCANKAWRQGCENIALQQTGKSAAFYAAAMIVAEENGFDGKTEQFKWAMAHADNIPNSID